MTDHGIDPVLLRGLQNALDPLVPRAAAVNRITETLRRANDVSDPDPQMHIRLRLGSRVRALMVAALTVAVVAGALVAGFGLRSRSTSPHHAPQPAPATAPTSDSTTVGGYFDVSYAGGISGQTHQTASCRFFNSPGVAEVVISGIDPDGAPIPTGSSGLSTPTGHAQVYLLFKNPPGVTDGTFGLRDQVDVTALRGGMTQATVAFTEPGPIGAFYRSTSGTVVVLNRGVDGQASASLLRYGFSSIDALPSATAVVTWSCAPETVEPIDPCTLMTSHEASVLTGVAMGPAVSVPSVAAGPTVWGLTGPLYLCEFRGTNVNVSVEAYHGASAAAARAYFDGQLQAHSGGFPAQRLSGLGNGAAIVHFTTGGVLDTIYVIDGTNVFDIDCAGTGCADHALEAAATFAMGRLP